VAAGHEAVVFEASDVAGGKVQTRPFAGRHFDTAADSFLARRPEAVRLCEELGIADELVPPSEAAAYVWSRGRLRRLPAGLVLGAPVDPVALARSGVLSPLGIARAALERVVPGSPLDGDAAVGEVIARRFGREVNDRLVDPLLGGINAGDTRRLSIDATAPQLAAAARRDRSLTKALSTMATAVPAGAGPVFLTPRGGLGTIVQALLDRLDDVRLSTPVEAVEATGSGWRVGGEHVDGLVLAVPAFAMAPLLVPHAPDAAGVMAGIEHASVVLTMLAYRRHDVPHPLDGSGFLVPRPEGRLVTACSWASSKWAHLADPDTVVLRVSAGRIDDERAMGMGVDAVLATVADELRLMMGVDAAPTEAAVHRWPRSFPQYAPGHLERVARATASLPAGLAVAGAALGGVGLPACIGSGRTAAKRARGEEPAKTR
jgi:oxygen-dependent protoporphyrinogen oxidase